MNAPYEPGHLSYSGLSLRLIRKANCVDCQAEIEGPPSMRRCPACQQKLLKATRAARMKRYRAKKRNFNATARAKVGHLA